MSWISVEREMPSDDETVDLQKKIDEALIKINKAPNQLSYNDAIEALLILKGKKQ